MSKYELDELARLWRLQRLTIEQMVGQLTLYAQDFARQVPTQAEDVTEVRERFFQVEQEVEQLKEGQSKVSRNGR